VVRYTTDEWLTSTDVNAVYLNGSCDGFSDKFTFSVDYSRIAGMVGKKLQFCLKFVCAGNEYWDNNAGKNYVFQCFGPSPLSATFGKPPWRRRAATVTTAAAGVPSPLTSNNNINCHNEYYSQSPAMHEDPWLRYL
jgi:protein phosphatase 1 regulatory subunit 3A/B/C/D/E